MTGHSCKKSAREMWRGFISKFEISIYFGKKARKEKYVLWWNRREKIASQNMLWDAASEVRVHVHWNPGENSTSKSTDMIEGYRGRGWLNILEGTVGSAPFHCQSSKQSTIYPQAKEQMSFLLMNCLNVRETLTSRIGIGTPDLYVRLTTWKLSSPPLTQNRS